MNVQVLGVDESDRVFVSVWAVAVGVCAALALGFAGAVLLLGDASPASDPQPVPAAVSADCADAVRRADAALVEARALDAALSEHTGVVDDLMADRVSADEAVQRMLAVLTAGSRHSTAMDVAVQRYEQAARACRP